MYHDGATREELEQFFDATGRYMALLWPDPTRSELFSQAYQWFYADWPYINDTLANRRLIGESLTDHAFGASADFHAKLSADDTMPVYFYAFRYLPENQEHDWTGKLAPVLGKRTLLQLAFIRSCQPRTTQARRIYCELLMLPFRHSALGRLAVCVRSRLSVG